MARSLVLGSVLSVISGTALWLSFPEFAYFPLAWVGLVPYLFFLLRKPPWGTVLAAHVIMSFIYFGGTIYWIPRVLTDYGDLHWIWAATAYLLLVALMSLFLLPFSLLTRWAAKGPFWLSLWCLPGLWMLTELARNYFLVSGFPWSALGYSQYPYSWVVQIADVGGVYSVSLLVVSCSCAVVGTLVLRSAKPLALFAALFFATNLYGAYRLEIWEPEPVSSIRTALIQPNIGLSGNQEHYAGKYYETLPDLYRQAAGAGAEWVIFPEAPNPFPFQRDFYFKTFWQREVATQGSYLLFNTASFETAPGSRYLNSALMLDPQGQPVYRYDKVHLVPFGEYVPMSRWLGYLFEPLVQEVAEFSPGEATRSGSVSTTRFGTLICFEGIFPELSRAFVRDGAQVLINLTNDAWYGRSAAPRQHLQIASFRAIEVRKPLLRCANSGYSAVIDPQGRTTQELGLFQEGLLMADVAGNNYRSIYSYIGEWLNIVIAGLSLVAASLAGLDRSRRSGGKKRKGR